MMWRSGRGCSCWLPFWNGNWFNFPEVKLKSRNGMLPSCFNWFFLNVERCCLHHGISQSKEKKGGEGLGFNHIAKDCAKMKTSAAAAQKIAFFFHWRGGRCVSWVAVLPVEQTEPTPWHKLPLPGGQRAEPCLLIWRRDWQTELNFFPVEALEKLC